MIGRTCKRRNPFSEAVRTVDRLAMSTGFRHPSRVSWPVTGSSNMTPKTRVVPVVVRHRRRPQASEASRSRFQRGGACPRTRSGNHRTQAVRARQRPPGFVGDLTQGEIPDPIPNSEVKTLRPMILLCGKVGDRRLDGPWWHNHRGPSLFPPSGLGSAGLPATTGAACGRLRAAIAAGCSATFPGLVRWRVPPRFRL